MTQTSLRLASFPQVPENPGDEDLLDGILTMNALIKLAREETIAAGDLGAGLTRTVAMMEPVAKDADFSEVESNYEAYRKLIARGHELHPELVPSGSNASIELEMV